MSFVMMPRWRRFRFRRCPRYLGVVMMLLSFTFSAYVFVYMYTFPNERNHGDIFEDVDKNRKQGLMESRKGKIRQNLIIVAHGRSGSSFTGNIFNHHPSVFYLFEPYQTVERLHGGVAPFNRDYQEESFEWMQGVLKCRFVSPKHANDIQHYYRKVVGKASRETQASIALSSPPFCRYNTTDPRWTLQDSCPDPFEQKMLEEVCEKKYSLTVVKALMVRMPSTSIEQLINVCDSSQEVDCKLLFLVRDPRGIIP